MSSKFQNTLSLLGIVCVLLASNATYVFARQNPQLQFEKVFGRKGIEQGELNSPQGISVNISGTVYVADTGNNRIQMYSPHGEFLKLIGGFGWNSAQFDEPVGIWGKDGLQVFITDKNNHRVLHYDSNLNLVTFPGSNTLTDESPDFRYPVSVARSDQGDLFVVDSEDSRVVRLNTAGQSENSFGGYNETGRPLIQPVSVIVQGVEKIYVSDAGRKEVVVYDYFGNYNHSLGQGMLRQPAGIEIDERGTLFICDKETSQIVMFNSSGQFVSKLTHPSFKSPVDVAYMQNRLYILDQENSTIFVFRLFY